MDKFVGDISALKTWAEREYNDAIASRWEYDNYLSECVRMYEMIPKTAQKETPWPGAPNLEVGEAASHCDAVYSRIEEAWFQTSPWCKVQFHHPSRQAQAEALQSFMNDVTLPKAGYRLEIPQVILGMTKLGTAFQWCSFDTEYTTTYRNGRKVRHNVHTGPIHKYLSPRQVIFPADIRDIQKGRWIGIRSYYTLGELRHFEQKGYFSNIDAIKDNGRIITSDASREGERESGLKRSGSLLQWEIVQMFCRWYNPRPKDLEDIWLVFDYPSMEILAAHYPLYDHMLRPLTKYTYMVREGAFAGIGIVGMMKAIQEEITDIHNYSLASMLFTITPAIAGPRNMQENIVFHPGMYMPKSGNNKDEFQLFYGGAVSQYPAQAEASTRAIGERRTGIGDASMQRMGGLGGGTNIRTPVGTTMALLGESNRRFALSIALGKEAEKEVLYQHVMLLKQHWSTMEPIARKWNNEKAELLSQLFSLDNDSFSAGVAVELSMSTAALNKDVERANLATISGYMQQYYAFMIQMKQMLLQIPQLEPEVTKAIQGANELVRITLNAYDIRNTETFILDGATTPAEGDAGALTDELISSFLSGRTSNTDSLLSSSSEGGIVRSPVESDLVG